ncbi:MAG: GHMP kinase [Candidatus Sabulitectum sp.]|nr:GHMP kinase [Candidatus Sabulitectum sp.]
MKKIDLFVPGRLCLFGEHSDWAGEYRKTDKTVKTGKCIIIGTDQGICGTAEQAANGFSFSQILPDGTKGPEQSYPSDPDLLAEIAAAGVFDSYAAGTASVILKRYSNLGLKLQINKRDLPLKKGLSSSAATCVLVARAFSRTHHLNLSIEEEMELAYRGELLTGSRCGRMDQACAYGKKPVLLTFDGDEMSTRSILSGEPLYLLIVDLRARKDTRRILEDLNFSFKSGNEQIRKALGEENHRITAKACRAIDKRDTRQLGNLMTEAQKVFDEMIAPICPSELTAPKLHQILQDSTAKDLAWGGKGVGSQGDGAAQFICKGKAERKQLKEILETNTGVLCYNLTL